MRFFTSLIFLFFCFFQNLLAQDAVPVDELPYFSGCSRYKANSKEKRECSNANLAYFLNQNLVYPDSAKAKDISGIVYVDFLVEKNGFVSNIKVLNNIGGGCMEVAKNVIKKMPAWEAALYKGKPIDYELRLPIQFKLDADTYADACNVFWGDLRYDQIKETELEKYLFKIPTIRDNKGETLPIFNTLLVYDNNNTTKKAEGKAPFTSDMKKLLKKAKAGSALTFVFTLQKKGTFFEVFKTYKVI